MAEYGAFKEVALLDEGDGTFRVEQDYVLPDPPGAVTIADFNHDGKLDIVAGMGAATTHPELKFHGLPRCSGKASARSVLPSSG